MWQTTTSKRATPNPIHHFLHLQAQRFFLLDLRGFRISPNLVSRLAADFAHCYQLQHISNRGLANHCLKDAENIFALANTSYPGPVPTVDSGRVRTLE